MNRSRRLSVRGVGRFGFRVRTARHKPSCKARRCGPFSADGRFHRDGLLLQADKDKDMDRLRAGREKSQASITDVITAVESSETRLDRPAEIGRASCRERV